MDGSAAIRSCLAQLDLSCDLVKSNVDTLAAATADSARLARILRINRCYQLATEGEIRSAQYQLASEIEPPIRELIARAEAGMDKLRKREKQLAARTAPRPSPTLVARLNDLRAQREALQADHDRLEAELRLKRPPSRPA